MAKEKIGFIGLGWMGVGMVQKLAEAGYDVTVWARRAEAVKEGMDAGATYNASSVKELAQRVTIVSLMVSDDKAAREMLEGPDGLFENMAPGSLILVHSTLSLDIIKEFAAKAEAKGLFFSDSPVSGDVAYLGEWTVIVGCKEENWSRIEPIGKCWGYPVRVGDVGCGAVAKLVNNTALICTMFGTSHAIMMGEKAGCDPEKLIEVMTQKYTTSNSWFVKNYIYQCPSMLLFAKGEGAQKLLPKDLQLGLNLGKSVGQQLPVAEACVGLSYADCVCDAFKNLGEDSGQLKRDYGALLEKK